MANDNLRAALAQAGLQPEELAELVEVDIRTVRRWLSGHPPYPRHRGKVARALDTTERALWPEIAVASVAAPAAAPVNEIVAGYARSDDVHAPSTEQLISTARERIDLLDDTLERLFSRPGVPELLADKASHACRIRILISHPGAHLAPLLGHDGIKLRATGVPQPQAVHRVDDDMLVSLRLNAHEDQPPPLLRLHRHTDHGLFDRLADHFDDEWERAGTPIETQHDLRTHLDGGGLDEQAGEAKPESLEPVPEQPTRQFSPLASPSGRRWPRRPADSP